MARPEVGEPIFVFVGPSMPPEEQGGRGVALLPPAGRGDILRLLPQRPAAIGLIDGVFGDRPAPLLCEILAAIEDGIAVYGAASMGALRAVELAQHGMIGIGRVFEAFRDGHLCADDEVAVLHGPAELGWQTLTVPLVDLRETAAAAIAKSVVDAHSALALVEYARRLPFSDRTWERLAESSGRARELVAELRRHWISVKKLDAAALLATLRSRSDPRPNRRTAPRSATLTSWTERHMLLEGRTDDPDARCEAGSVPDLELWHVSRLFLPGYANLHARVVRTLLAAPGHMVSRDAFAANGPSVTGLGLRPWDLAEWCGAQDATSGEPLPEGWRHLRSPDGRLPGLRFVTALKLSPLLAPALGLAHAAREANCRLCVLRPEFRPGRLAPGPVFEVFARQTGIAGEALDAFVLGRGFADAGDLLDALRLTHALRRITPTLADAVRSAWLKDAL